MARPSAFKSEQARVQYCRLYDEAVALSPVPVEESDVETSFGTTHLLSAGDPAKPPLLALHALSMSATMWLPLLPALTASHRVHLLDTIGEPGKSVATGLMSSPARMIAWIDEVRGTLGVERSAVVGASQGAWMAARYAMAHPQRVERLALVDPAGIVSPLRYRWMWRALSLRLRPGPAKIEAFVDSLVMEQTRPVLRADPWRPIVAQLIAGLETFRRSLREPRPERCSVERLAAAGIEVLLLVGADETLHDGPVMAQRFRRELPDAQTVLVDDANHLIFIDQQDLVAGQLRCFLGPS